MPRIVHLGFGSFHRAHQAWYTAHANALRGTDWRITGVSMRRPDLRDALSPQEFAYTLAERGADGLTCHRIGVHDRVVVASEAPEAVIAAIADPETAIVTLTITEKGYALDASGQLDLTDPAIDADLRGTGPSSAIGLLAYGLAQRARSGAPLTVISCDNLPENGPKLAAAIRAFSTAAKLKIGDYLSGRVCFPASMVDRITPATSDSIRAEINATCPRPCAAPVLTESFSEWVIEDQFAGPRPAWDVAGATLTGNVAPFEARKLLMLNAAHSYLAYGGLCRGHTFVHEAMADPSLRADVNALWDLAPHALAAGIHTDLSAYRAALTARFEVSEMRHRLDQIATDGSQKLPVRIVPLLRAAQATGAKPGAAQAALSAWVAYLIRSARDGTTAADPGLTELLPRVSALPLPEAIAETTARIGLSAGPDVPTEADVRTWLAQ